MERNRLNSLDTFHEEVLNKTTEDLLNNLSTFFRQRTGKKRKLTQSKISRELSNNDTSALLVDEFRIDPEFIHQ